MLRAGVKDSGRVPWCFAVSVDENALIAAFAASPYRALVIRELERRIDTGEDVPPTFIATLTRLRLLQELPPTDPNFEARQDRMPVVEVEYEARWRAAMLAFVAIRNRPRAV